MAGSTLPATDTDRNPAREGARSVRSVASNELVPAGTLGLDVFGRARGTVSPIWPPAPGNVEWPPARTMSHQDLEDLAEGKSAVGAR